MKNLYEVLGVPKEATKNAIKKAYRRLALKLHPDKNKEADPADFHEIQLAYSILMDDERREEYDETGTFRKRNEPTLRDQALNEMCNLYMQLIQMHGYADKNYFFLTKERLISIKGNLQGEIQALESKKESLETILENAKAPQAILDTLADQINQTGQEKATKEKHIKVVDEGLALVKECEYLGEEEPPRPHFEVNFSDMMANREKFRRPGNWFNEDIV